MSGEEIETGDYLQRRNIMGLPMRPFFHTHHLIAIQSHNLAQPCQVLLNKFDLAAGIFMFF